MGETGEPQRGKSTGRYEIPVCLIKNAKSVLYAYRGQKRSEGWSEPEMKFGSPAFSESRMHDRPDVAGRFLYG